MRGIAAVILAAGGSTRFGAPKQVLQFAGRTLVKRIAHAAIDAGCAPVVVVVGDAHEQIIGELHDLKVTIVPNHEWRRGLGTSIRIGVQHSLGLDQEVRGVLILACDQPFVDSQVISAIIEQVRVTGKPIVASHYADTVGIPAFFDRKYFKQLTSLPEDGGAKALIHSHLHDVAQVEFEPGAIDIDTPADYAALTRRSPS